MAKSAETYVWQLFADAHEANQVEAIRTELRLLLKVLQAQPGFFQMLSNPAMAGDQQQAIIKSTFSEQISDHVVALLAALNEEDDMECLEEIEILYDQIVSQYLEEHFNILEGQVVSAIPLSDDQLKTLVGVFEKKTGKEVRFTAVVDESLIGGYQVKMRDQVYDDSVKLQLKQLKESLVNTDLG